MTLRDQSAVDGPLRLRHSTRHSILAMIFQGEFPFFSAAQVKFLEGNNDD